MQRKAHIAIDEHRALSDPTIDKLGGVHPRHPPRPPTEKENTAPTAEVPTFAKDTQGSTDQGQNLQPDGQPVVDPEHWRQYATPAATPTGDNFESEDSIHVDIAPVEPGTEHSNWESFIHQLGDR
jgi:hypothetical protein